MFIEKVNSWIAIIANIGVIASIVFLAFEIQQNTKVRRAATLQEIQRDLRDALLEGAKDCRKFSIRCMTVNP